MAAAQMVITLVRRPHWTADQFHSDYCNDMKSQGWSFGEEYDAERKLTPMLVDYDQLPIEQRMEDQVFRAVVFALYFKED